MLPIYLHSSSTLEDWSWETPWKTGIGGSEISHVEMALRLAKRGHIVISHCPLPHDKHATRHGDVAWFDCRKTEFPEDTSAIIINYRNPHLFDREKNPRHKYWFVAQDVDYANQWTERAMKNVDRYIVLCHTHADYTLSRYPLLRENKVFLSSNGIRTDYIEKLPYLEREPYRMFWASSPDRGLLMLLQNWFRIRERFPQATLRIAYGFNNMDTIIKWQGAGSQLAPLKAELEALGSQEGITWLGRLPQDKVFQEWQQAACYPASSDWPESSGITFMEAMACGAIVVCPKFWAQGEHCSASPLAYISDGLPQKSELARNMWLANLYEVLEKSASGDFDKPVSSLYDYTERSPREELERWALERYNWENMVSQFEKWAEADSAAILNPPKKKRAKRASK